jgi:hypothetical protein
MVVILYYSLPLVSCAQYIYMNMNESDTLIVATCASGTTCC